MSKWVSHLLCISMVPSPINLVVIHIATPLGYGRHHYKVQQCENKGGVIEG